MTDWQRYIEHLGVAEAGRWKQWAACAFRSPYLVVLLFRLSGRRGLVRYPALALYKLARIASGIQIPRGTRIGQGLLLPHHGCLVLNRHTVIGENCTLLHNVTIGAKGGGNDLGVPMIGNNVYVGAGAVILGSVTIGDGALIGANAVVVRDVPAGCIAVGNPARVVERSTHA